MPVPVVLPLQAEKASRSGVRQRNLPVEDAMTIQQLCDEAWDEMPPIRKRLVGRARVHDMVRLAVINWEPTYIDACVDKGQQDVFASALTQELKRSYQPLSGYEPGEYGFFWMFLLSAAASALVQWLVKKWLDHRFSREQMAEWKRELVGAGS